jgi:hypothetical protein
MTDMTFSQGGGMQTQDLDALVEARLKAAMDEGARRPQPQIAEPAGWWNLWALGPWQVPAPGGPLLPHKVIKVGETFNITTVLWISPFVLLPPPWGIPVCTLISNLACYFEVDYCTGDLCKWTPADFFSPKGIQVPLVPNQCYYIRTQQFVARPGTEGCFETMICVKLKGCPPNSAPPLAGFVTAIRDFDPDWFYPWPGPVIPPPVPGGPTSPAPGVPPRWEFDIPLRFMIYP